MRKKIAALMFCAAALSLSATAQAKKGKLMQSTDVKGTILREKEVSLPNSSIRDLVVEVKTDDGRRIPVDLGPTDRLKNLSLTIGSPLTASGMIHRVGDRPVLFAQKLSLPGGTSFKIQRIIGPSMKGTMAPKTGLPSEEGAGMEGHPGGMTGKMAAAAGAGPKGEQKVTGRIIHLKDVTVQAPKAEVPKGEESTTEEPATGKAVKSVDHQVVMLRTSEGQNVIVDLGPKNKLQRVRIRNGARISVQARPVRIGDRLLLLADRLIAGGKTVRIVQVKPMSAMRAPAPTPSEPGGTEGGGKSTPGGSPGGGKM